MRQKLVVGNWKMHGTRASVRALLEELAAGTAELADTLKVAVAPAFIHLGLAGEVLKGSKVGLAAQDLSPEPEGAYTGEVSGPMLADYGVSHVIVGHSERRTLFGESNALAAAKFKAALDHGLVPILCLGETQTQRESGITEQTVLAQLDAVIEVAGLHCFHDAVIAYEPVWAIGTGQTASPQQAQEVHWLLRDHLGNQDAAVAAAVQIIYGGSVNADNAGKLFREADIDGGLVGGASLNAGNFLSICESAD